MERAAANLLAEKVMREVYRIAQAYGKEHPYAFDDLLHDLAVMLEVGSLQSVSLKFHRPTGERQVLVEYNYAFHAGTPRFYLDDAQGLGIVPLCPPFEMGLVVQNDPPVSALQGRLKLNWSAAPQYAKGAGYAQQDGNTTQRTGGRASKQVFIGEGLRCRGQIKFYLPARQYGFVQTPEGVDIFFHANNLHGFLPYQGQAVTYLPLATPRGIQAKDVRAA